MNAAELSRAVELNMNDVMAARLDSAADFELGRLVERAPGAVHLICERATELIHIGQAVLSFNGTIDYFVNTVFNYPTLAECYKIAALDGLNRLSG